MPMNEDTLLRRLVELAPFSDPAEARRAFDATLRAMRRGLNDDEADWLAVALGPALAAPLLRETHAGDLTKEELYRWTKRNAKTRKSVAVEHVQVICRALAELLQPAELERLKRHLPHIASLLQPRAEEDPPSAPRQRRPDPPDHTLAGGRPGSSRPLSEAAPIPGRSISSARQGVGR